MTKKIIVRSPSNLALIKYMGKEDFKNNLPSNPSLSVTLNNLCTVTEISSSHQSGKVVWKDECPDTTNTSLDTDVKSFRFWEERLNEEQKQRAIDFVYRSLPQIQELLFQFQIRFKIPGQISIQSRNTFPSSCGIASSASAFSSLTFALAASLVEDRNQFEQCCSEKDDFLNQLASISRLGSGSSCRSFAGPLVLWSRGDVKKFNHSFDPLVLFVLTLDSHAKNVSSSEAHRRVLSSYFWPERQKLVSNRMNQFLHFLTEKNWNQCAQIVWDEMQEMHYLFHTAQPPFTYWTEKTFLALRQIQTYFKTEEIFPWVTLDAGPNIHFLVQKQYRSYWREKLKKDFQEFSFFEDKQGTGVEVIKFENYES